MFCNVQNMSNVHSLLFQLLIGNYGLTISQSKAQMAIWAVLAAPLIMSNKLSSVRPEFKEILQNKEVIKVNQDALGIQGTRVFRVRINLVFLRCIRFIRFVHVDTNKENLLLHLFSISSPIPNFPIRILRKLLETNSNVCYLSTSCQKYQALLLS